MNFKVTIDKNIPSYANDPEVIKKLEEAKKFIEKAGVDGLPL